MLRVKTLVDDATHGHFGSIPLEIADEIPRVRTDRAKVDRLATSLEQQQPVERLEEERVRLVNRAQDLLAGSGEFAQESDDIVSALTVQTGSWFVQEEQELRLGGKLDTNGQPLSSFNSETKTERVSRSGSSNRSS